MKNLMLLISALALPALAGEIQPLWPSLEQMPDRQPDQIAYPSELTRSPDFKRDDHRMPYLDWCEAPEAGVKKNVCMILISGGGYNSTCDGPAFKAFEERLRREGVTCVYLWYRTPRPKGLEIYRTAWEDGQRAVRLVRSQAKARGFDPEKIGVMGCSAGSHLSVLLATSSQTPAYAKVDALDDVPCHINWAVPHCTAYALDDGLTGPNANKGEGAKLNPAFRFDAKTCPMCLFHGEADIYSPLGSTEIYRQLRRMKIPAELHLDADRRHGVCAVVRFERAIEFMRQMNYFGDLGNPRNYDHRYYGHNILRTEKEYLWPEGKKPDPQPNQKYEPYLVWYIPEKQTTKAIQVVLPGGGYSGCSYNNEGTPSAQYFTSKGMTAVVVYYRCPRPQGLPKHKSAWQDAQRAIRMVRSEAPARGLDPERIGVMGYSAGGHLTLMASTSSQTPAYAKVDALDDVPCHVNWAFPIYPAYSLTDGADVPNVKGGNEDDSVLVPEFAFDRATPPMCLSHGDADGWAAMNSVKVWEKLRRMGLSADLHTYATRGHCFHMSASDGTGSATCYDRLWDFLVFKGLNRDETAAKTEVKDSGTKFMEKAIAPFVESGEFPGCISVLYKDGVQETACLGYADVAAKRPMTLDSHYMQCSQTKGFCGVTVAKLVEEGRLDLDDPVSKYLPEFKELWVEKSNSNGVRIVEKAKTVLTVRMCLNHTGGFPFELPNAQEMGGWSRRMPLRSVAATAASQPIKFDPGTQASYSNVGIDIGAAVVEAVTGKRWEAYLSETVLRPLGMNDSTFWPTEAQLADKIELYDVPKDQPAKWRYEQRWMQRPYGDDRVFSSAGAGLWTTVRDQYRFYKMLMNLGVGDNGVRILKEETVKSILALSTRPAGLGGYSLGLNAPEKDSEEAWFGHGGAWSTNCMVNWHKRWLKLWAVQVSGENGKKVNAARNAAQDAFFKAKIDNSGSDAYTGRLQ